MARTIDNILENFKRFDFAIVFLFEQENSKIEVPALDARSIFKITKLVPTDDETLTFVTILSKKLTTAYTSEGLEIRSGDERIKIVPILKSISEQEARSTVFLERRLKTKNEKVSMPINFRYTFIEEALFKGLLSNVILIERDYQLTYKAILEPRELYAGHPVYYNTMNFDELYGFLMHVKNQLETDANYQFTCIIKLVPKRIGDIVDKGESSIIYNMDTTTWGIPEVCRVYKFISLANICVFTTDKSSQAFSDGFELTSLNRRFIFINEQKTKQVPIISQTAYTKFQQNKIDISTVDLSLSKDTPVYIHQYPVDNIEWYKITRKYSEETAPSNPEVVLYTLNSIMLLPSPKEQVFPINYTYSLRSSWLPRLFVYLTSESLYINTLVKYIYDHAEEHKTTQFVIGPLSENQYNIIQFASNPANLAPQMSIKLLDPKNALYMLIIQGAFCSPLTMQVDTSDQNPLVDMYVFSFKFAETYSTNILPSNTYAVYLASVKGCTNDEQPGLCSIFNRKRYTAIRGYFLNSVGYSSNLYPIEEYAKYTYIQEIQKLETYTQLSFTSPMFNFMQFESLPYYTDNVPYIFVWEHKQLEPPLHGLVRNPEKYLSKHPVVIASHVAIKPTPTTINDAKFSITSFNLQSSYFKHCIVGHDIKDTIEHATPTINKTKGNIILLNKKPMVNLYDEPTSTILDVDYNGIRVPSIDIKRFTASSGSRWSVSNVKVQNISCRLYTPSR